MKFNEIKVIFTANLVSSMPFKLKINILIALVNFVSDKLYDKLFDKFYRPEINKKHREFLRMVMEVDPTFHK